MKVLVLGGTMDGRRIAEKLFSDSRFEPLLSYAGRTASLQDPGVPHRIGGFGGASGLGAFLKTWRARAVVDATHPFAAQISTNCVEACRVSGTRLIRLERRPWEKTGADRWVCVDSMNEAAAAIGIAPRRVFLTVGRLEVAAFCSAPQHSYLIRAVDPFPLPHGLEGSRILTARGPFELERERQLLESEQVDVIVSKNSGTDATYAKIAAARELGLQVVIVNPPRVPAAQTVSTLEAVIEWLSRISSGVST